MNRHESALVEALRAGVFHVTTFEGYKGIQGNQILPRFGDSAYPRCFARTQGYVSLFDFRNVTAEQLDLIEGGTWEFHFPPHGHPFGIALRIDVDRLGTNYLPPRVDEFPDRLAIPYVEGWSAVAIDWTLVIGGFIYSPETGPISLTMLDGAFPELDKSDDIA